MKQQHKVYNLIILDESGSMESIKNATIRGFNEVAQTIRDVESKFPEQKHFISLVTFNGCGIKDALWNREVDGLELLNDTTYRPDCSTPLYDAIGRSCSKLKEEIPGKCTYNVLVTILTDGEENASRNYSGAAIKQMIDELKQQSWTFAYIGANHNVEEAAANLSISNMMVYDADEEGMEKMFAKDKKSRILMANMCASWDWSKSANMSLINIFQEEEEEEGEESKNS